MWKADEVNDGAPREEALEVWSVMGDPIRLYEVVASIGS
jgi:hypothetical protein